MANQHAIRNLPITESLKATIARAVGAVYGLGFEVLVYSGGQHDHETATRLSVPRAGTKAHDHGHAADVYVVAPDGVRLTGDALAPLAQYWLASGHGGVGLEMNGGGVHLDEGRVRFWDYASDGGSVTRTQLAAMLAGKRGVMPTLHSSHSHNPNSEIRSRVRGLLDYIQRYESEGATKSQGVESAYLVVYGGIASGDRPSVRLTNMTVAEVLAWQDSIDAKYSSEAAGAYQVMEDTLRDLVKAARVDANALFDEKVQDTVAELLLERRGLSEFMSGKISAEDFADQLAREWAGFPVVRDQMGHKRYVQRGQSFYAGDGLNKAHADPDEFLSVLRSILSD
jgi:muramidase (phage lysozyme)